MTDTSTEAPSGMERRLSLRILSYWREIRGEENFPAYASINSDDITDMWPFCAILKVTGHEQDPLITHCGDNLQNLQGEDVSGQPLSAAPKDSLIANGLSYFQRVLDKRVPITYGNSYSCESGETVFYRSAILPLSDDGEKIDYLLCAANCRKEKAE